MTNTYYVIMVLIGEWEDSYEFIYKDLYFRNIETAKEEMVILEDLVSRLKDSEAFLTLSKLDSDFTLMPSGDIPYLSLEQITINVV